MQKYSTQIKDRVSDHIRDDKVKLVSGEVENLVLTALLGDNQWPAAWKRAYFDPAQNMTDTLEVINSIFPNEKWSVVCVEPNRIYEAYVKDATYSVFSFRPERALFLAMWNAWRLEHDTISEEIKRDL